MMTKVNVFLIVLVLFFTACKEKNTENYEMKNNSNYLYNDETCKQNFVDKWTKEVLQPNEMYLNDKKLYSLTTDSIIQIIGKPDTIYFNNRILGARIYNFEKKLDYWFYGKTIFSVNEKGECWIVNLDFNSTNLIIETPFINLKKDVTLKEIIDVFPYSSSRIKTSGNLWSGSIEIHATWNGSHGRWLLNFTKQKLRSITLIN